MPPTTRPTLEQIYRNHRRDVVRLVSRRAPLAYVDELVQDCFLAMHRTLATYDPSQKILPWIKTVVIRTVRDFLELGRIRNELLGVGGPATDRSESFEPSLIQRDLLDDLMTSLTEDERQVAVLVWVDGLGPAAIAEELGMTPGRAISLRRRSLTRLQAALRRHQARERRVLGERAIAPAFALFSRATAYLDRARSLIFRFVARTKASIAHLATSAGLAIALSAAPAPSPPTRVPLGDAPLDSAPTAVPTAAWIPPTARTPPAAPPIEAPPPSPAPHREPAPPTHTNRIDPLFLEQRSLERIRVLLDTNQAAAHTALEHHKRTFPHEHLRDERQTLEDLIRAKLTPSPPTSRSKP